MKKLKLLLPLLLIFTLGLCLTACSDEEGKYTVSFMVDETVYHSIQTAGNEKITLPDEPKKDGYVFLGWYLYTNDDSEKFEEDTLLNTVLEKDITLYAKWQNSPDSVALLEMQLIGNEYCVVGAGGFEGENLVIPTEYNSVPVTSIGVDVFRYSTVKSITIPASVTDIGTNAFFRCSRLESITVEEGNPRYKSSGNCLIDTETKTLILGCKNSVIPSDGNVTVIGMYAFSGAIGLTDIVIPEGVTKIYATAFDECRSLANVSLPDSLKYLNSELFNDCSALVTHSEGGVNYIDKWVISVDDNVENVALRVDTVGIASGAFLRKTKLKSISLPEGIKYLGSFEGCTSLSSIDIPESVTTVDSFDGCTALSSLNIPDGVSGSISLAGCTSLESLDLGNITYISDMSGCTSLTELTIPRTVIGIGNGALVNLPGVVSVTVEDGNGVFHVSGNCLIQTETKTLVRAFKNPTVPTDGSVTVIGSQAFSLSLELREIVIPSSVTEIRASAFAVCKNLEAVTLSMGVEKIGALAFSGCESLTRLNMPSSLKSIEEYAFLYCTALSSVDLPDSLININDRAFAECASLTLEVEGGIAYLDGWAMYPVEEATAFTVRPGTVGIAESAFSHSDITSITLNEELKHIGSHAFSGCDNLAVLTLPSGLETIERNAFSFCDALLEIVIPATVSYIGRDAFGGITDINGLVSVTFENPEGWLAGDVALPAAELAKPGVAASYLKTQYKSVAWVRS